MKTSASRHSLLALPLLLVFVGCGSLTPPNSQSNGDAEGAQLSVSNLKVTDYKDGTVTVGKASFDLVSGASYAELVACQQNNCEPTEKLITNVHILKPLKAGSWDIKVRACFENTAQDGSVACGKFSTASYDASGENDPLTISLIQKRDASRKDLNEIALKIRAALEKYAQQSEQCLVEEQDKAKVETMRKGVGLLLKIGEAVLTKSFDPVIQRIKDDPKAELGSLIADLDLNNLISSVSNWKSELGSMDGLIETLDRVGTSLGFFKDSDTVGGVAELGNAVLDMFTPKSQVDIKCVAQQIAQMEISNLKQLLEWKQKDIQDIEAILLAK